MSHSFWGSGIQTGHNEDKLTLFQCVRSLSWKSSTLGSQIIVKLIHAVPGRFLLAGGLAGVVIWKILTWPRPWAVGFVTWWLGSKGKRRGRENQAEAILPFMINLMSHKMSSHWLGQLQVQLSSRGGNCVTPPLDGEACSRHPMNMWSGTYIGGTISRESIICHGGLAGNTGNDKHWVILYNIILSHMVCNGWPSSMWAGVAPKK